MNKAARTAPFSIDRSAWAWILTVSTLLGPVACNSASLPAPVDAPDNNAKTVLLYDVDDLSQRPFFELPFPNNLRLNDDGSVNYDALKEKTAELMHPFFDLTAANQMKGFSTIAPVFFRFSGAIDTSALPADEKASLADDAVVVFVDIDEGSSTYGKRIPYRWKYSEAGQGKYIGENYLAIAALPGFVLAPKTTYAVLIRESLKDAAGKFVGLNSSLENMLAQAAPDSASEKAHLVHQPLRAYLKAFPQLDIVGATVFTTGNPRALMPKLRQAVLATPEPQPKDLKESYVENKYCQVTGTYEAPNFLRGATPYLTTGEGGDIVLDGDGLPVIERMESIRFHLTVPEGPMPEGGWPLVLYGHGTGGSYKSYLGSGMHKELSLLNEGDESDQPRFAMVGIDQVHHGYRKNEGKTSLFAWFNELNPTEAVSVMLQGGVDNVSLLRAMKALRVTVAAAVDNGENQPHCQFQVDPSKVYYMGHSQGAFTGAPFLSVSPEVRGAVFSGARGHLSLGFVERVRGASMKEIIEVVFQEKMDIYHPLLAVLQHALDPADPLNYAPQILQRPENGAPPKHVFLVGGINDSYAPMEGIEALAKGLGTPLVYSSDAVPGPTLEVAGLDSGSLPATLNTLSASGESATSGLVLYEATNNEQVCSTDDDCADQGKYYICGTQQRCTRDGHFVMFVRKNLKSQLRSFFVSDAIDSNPTIPSPPL